MKSYTAIVLFVFLLASVGTVTAVDNDGSEYVDEFQDSGIGPNVIEIRGNKTILNVDQMHDFLRQIAPLMLKYHHPNNGSVISYGYDFTGYFTVEFLEGSKVNKTTIDDIYKIHDAEAQKRGIQDVGVAFQFSGPASEEVQLDVEMPEDVAIVEMPEDVAIEEREDNTSAPGFSALTLLLVFSIIMWFRRD
ncbi:hypothetical protein V7O66_02170 [Methanolobus sp. ZRKC3]|uniref:hypothetical protein n=1 Tax=Methanolobus sp. ZRKC3 TaxID=3125786 RepID=UPI00324A439E